MALQRCAGFEKPRAAWEQYQTPPSLAARLLYDAYMNGDIEGNVVTDLGCGTGILAIGAALFGALTVRAVDLDPAAIHITGENAILLGVNVELYRGRYLAGKPPSCAERIGPCDTVVMNPPFGAQKKCTPTGRSSTAPLQSHRSRMVYSTPARPRLWRHTSREGQELPARVSGTFPIKRSFAFHTKGCAGGRRRDPQAGADLNFFCSSCKRMHDLFCPEISPGTTIYMM